MKSQEVSSFLKKQMGSHMLSLRELEDLLCGAVNKSALDRLLHDKNSRPGLDHIAPLLDVFGFDIRDFWREMNSFESMLPFFNLKALLDQTGKLKSSTEAQNFRKFLINASSKRLVGAYRIRVGNQHMNSFVKEGDVFLVGCICKFQEGDWVVILDSDNHVEIKKYKPSKDSGSLAIHKIVRRGQDLS